MGFENMVIDKMAEQAAGRLKAVALIQKRVRELERGWPALIPTAGESLIQIALEEFRRELISLASGEEAEELRASRVIEERERARAIEAARRAEADAAPPSRPPSGGLFGAPLPAGGSPQTAPSAS
jgi:DNA-directed RNA polymerase subunit K/omega